MEVSSYSRLVTMMASSKNSSIKKQQERLFKAIEASCRIPGSFHPFDMIVPNNLLQHMFVPGTSTGTQYPDEEGIEIDGRGHVDGGIAAPFPPTPFDDDPNCTGKIVVSPIAGEYFYCRNDNNSDNKDAPSSSLLLRAIRPRDVSWKLPLVGSLTLPGCTSGGDYEQQRQQQSYRSKAVAVRARPSIQNLRAMVTAIGVVPTNTTTRDGRDGGTLRDWYERGQADAHEMLSSSSSSSSNSLEH